ncbi:MAG: hypothetical protein RLZZ416_535 [Candidatus Parcubacteria bacterium]|jgi:hypothetical protein
MNTVLITIPSAPLSQGFLRTDFLEHLRDVRIVLIVPPFKKEYYAAEFRGRESIIVEAAPEAYRKFEDIAHRLLRQSIPSTTISMRQMHAFYSKRGLARWSWFLSTRVLWLLGHIRLWRELLRKFYALAPYRAYEPLIERYKPDLVFATTLFDRMDLGLTRAARRRGIPIVGMPKSWDSLTSKCFTPMKPDLMLVQNEITKREAMAYSDMPEARLRVVGIPQFDFYFEKSLLKPREAFLREIGIAAGKRYVLFTGGGLALFPDECEVLSAIHERMSADPTLSDTVLVYRPHPNYGWCTEAASWSNIVIASSHKKVYATTGGWEFERDDLQYLFNSIYHADVVLHMASTLAIEIALLDRPMIGIACDGERQKPFYRSSERYYHTSHFEPMSASGGMKIARTVDEIMAAIIAYRRDPSLDAEGRKRIVREEVVYTDGKAAARIAKHIREILAI